MMNAPAEKQPPISSQIRETSLFVEDRLRSLEREHRLRFLRCVETEQAARVIVDGVPVRLFCSNNYLGLANHPDLKAAAAHAVEAYGCGSGASRLISGNMTLHEKLERRIARFKNAEACIVFNNGYTANVGILSSLTGTGDRIFSDARNHASIIDGCRLSRAAVQIYRHRDVEHLESLLKAAGNAGRRLIVTDSLFSMDGDLAPLPELVRLARRYGCMLMVDEAHAVGVLGKNGRGAAEYFGVEQDVDISVGTLGKALGGFGAFAVCSVPVRSFLINHARSLIYSTSLPPSVLAAACRALEILQAEPWRRERLQENVYLFAKGLRTMGCRVPEPATPIQSLIMGDDATTMAMSERLLFRGVFAQGIRPPTVPPGASRIRFSLMATHETEDIRATLEAISCELKSSQTESNDAAVHHAHGNPIP